MMNNEWHDCFIEALYKKYPKKSQLVDALMGLLSIEKESVYRRLRKEIMFTVPELLKIASSFSISLDEIVGIDSKQVIFKARLWNYLKPTNEDTNEIQMFVQDINRLKYMPDMEYLEVSNKLSHKLAYGFPYLSKLNLLKWMYQFTDEEMLPFSQIAFPEKISKLSLEYYKDSKGVNNTSFIWDHMIFEYLVSDICYFHSINLINDDEKKLIKKDLYTFLNYMSEVATKGFWPETGNKVSLYISQINIDTNYSYYYSSDVKLCFVHAFAKNEIYTVDPVMVENFRIWMQSKKKSSILISEADERSRIEFFTKQRQLIDTL